MARQPKPASVETFWIKEANLYKTVDGKKIASISVSKIGYIITWHEFIPTRISQRLSSIWSSGEAAELIIYAAYAEAVEEMSRRENR